MRKQLKDLSQKTHTVIQPVFVSNKIQQELAGEKTAYCKPAVCSLQISM